MSEKEIDEISGVNTTGHEWDGIKELNNPLPRWWVNLFYITIVWAVIYWILMPAWPGLTDFTKGVRNHSERENVAIAMASLDEARAASLTQLTSVEDIADVERDPDLLQFALEAGGSLFGDNCATCHGAGGQGFEGYPSLVDDVWLWGGSLDAIEQTLRYGIRSTHPETRFNMMQAFGGDGLLRHEQIVDLVEYVVHLSGREADGEAVARAAESFALQCSSCHGATGAGIQAMGAPDLTDQIWLYGGDREAIYQSIYDGRTGVMPAWTDRLSDPQIVALAVYVHALGGGE